MTLHRYYPLLMIVGALFHIGGALAWPTLVPIRILAFALLLTGYLGLLGAMGRDRPLNLLATVLAGYAGLGQAQWLLGGEAGFGMLYIMAMLGAFFVTSVAALHRTGGMRRAGVAGVAASSLPLAGLVAGHVALGGFGILGVATLGGGTELLTWPGDLLIGGWSVLAGLFVWREARP